MKKTKKDPNVGTLSKTKLFSQNDTAYQTETNSLITPTDLERSEQKFGKVNRLYTFITQVNQNIVRIQDENALFQNACNIAIEYGNFNIAWIGMFDKEYKKITLVEQNGIQAEDLRMFIEMPCPLNSPQYHILRSLEHYIIPAESNEIQTTAWGQFAMKYAIRSGIVLPIKKSGTIIGTFNLYTHEPDFFDDEEIALLEEVAGDISFAIDKFEADKKNKVSETLVIQNERRYRALILKSEDLKKLSTLDGRTIYCSPSMTRAFGYSLEELLEASSFEFIHPKDIDAFKKNWDEVIKIPGAAFKSQSRFRHKNGSWIPCEGIVTNMLKQSGVHAMVSNFRDISRKRIAEQQQEFDQNNLLALINNTKDLMWSVDTEFRLITSNRSFDELVKSMSNNTIIKGGNVLSIGFPDEQLQRFKTFYDRAFSGETFTEIEHSNTPADFWSEISFYPIRNGHKVIGTACYSRDITDRMNQHIELEKQLKLEIRNKALEQFAYIASHDLQEPLRTVSNYIQIFEDDYPDKLDKKVHTYLQSMKHAVQRMSMLITSLLEFSRLDINKALKFTDCKKLVDEVIADLDGIIKTSDARIEIDPLPRLNVYETELRQLFQNLISNAIKFRKKQGPLHIKISCAEINNKWQFSVSDNGIGIDQVHFERIFEIFHRLHADNEYEGNGIGLANCKRIVQMHMGEIWLESILGHGTIFHFTIPML